MRQAHRAGRVSRRVDAFEIHHTVDVENRCRFVLYERRRLGFCPAFPEAFIRLVESKRARFAMLR